MVLEKKIKECITELRKTTPRVDESVKEYTNRLESICKVYSMENGEIKFPEKTDMNTRLIIYVPSTIGIHKQIGEKAHNARAREIESKLRRDFGGSTSVRSVGTWRSEQCPKKVCRDDIILVESFMSESGWKEHSSEIKKYLTRKKAEWGQESLSVEFQQFGKESNKQGLHFI